MIRNAYPSPDLVQESVSGSEDRPSDVSQSVIAIMNQTKVSAMFGH